MFFRPNLSFWGVAAFLSASPFAIAQETPAPPASAAQNQPRRGEFEQRENETPEQFRERLLAPTLEIVPDLSDDQKTHILAILEAVNMEMRAARLNKALSPTRARDVGRGLRGAAAERIKNALTEAQLALYDAHFAEQAETRREMDRLVPARAGEDLEQRRARVVKGYESVLEELSVKQKTALIKILEDAGEKAAAIDADATQSAAQKSAARAQLHAAVNAQVLPLLDAEQKVAWQKAHEAQKPGL